MEAEPNGEPTRLPVIMLMSQCNNCSKPIAKVDEHGTWVHMLTQNAECDE